MLKFTLLLKNDIIKYNVNLGGGSFLEIKESILFRKNIITLILFVVFSILTFFIGEKIYFLSILASLVLMIVSIQAHILISISFTVLGVAITYLLGGEIAAIKIALIYYIPSLLCGIIINGSRIRKIYIIKEKESKKIKVKQNQYASISTFLLSILVFAVGIALYYIVMKYIFDNDIIKNLQGILDKVVAIYRQNLSPQDLKRIEDTGVLGKVSNIGSIFAVLIFAKAVLYSIICYFVAIRLSNYVYSNKIEHIGVDNFVLPGKPVYVLFISILILFFVGYYNKEINTEFIIGNYIAVMSILFLLQGISLFIYIVKNWSQTKKAVNWILFILIILFMGIAPGLAIIGMLDNTMGYRDRWLSVDK